VAHGRPRLRLRRRPKDEAILSTAKATSDKSARLIP
jgi:hypothetical protein